MKRLLAILISAFLACVGRSVPTVVGNLQVQHAAFFTSQINCDTLTTDQNNYGWPVSGTPAVLTTETVYHLTASSPVSITGLVSAGFFQQVILVVNDGTQAITFVANSSSSSAPNRLAFSSNHVLMGGDSMLLLYDSGSQVWRYAGSPGSGGGGGGVTSIIAGTGISVDQSTGDVTITNTGGSGGGATVVSVAYSATLATDASQAPSGGLLIVEVGALTGDITLSNPTNPTNRQRLEFVLVQDATGGRALTFGSKFRFPSSSSLTSPVNSGNSSDFVAASKQTILIAEYDEALDVWNVVAFVPGY